MFGKNRARTSRAPLANFSLFRYTRTYLGTRQCNTLFWYTCTYLGMMQCNTLVACLQVPRVEILSLATRSHAAVSKILYQRRAFLSIVERVTIKGLLSRDRRGVLAGLEAWAWTGARVIGDAKKGRGKIFIFHRYIQEVVILYRGIQCPSTHLK